MAHEISRSDGWIQDEKWLRGTVSQVLVVEIFLLLRSCSTYHLAIGFLLFIVILSV